MGRRKIDDRCGSLMERAGGRSGIVLLCNCKSGTENTPSTKVYTTRPCDHVYLQGTQKVNCVPTVEGTCKGYTYEDNSFNHVKIN
jgi:hypothetical protein